MKSQVKKTVLDNQEMLISIDNQKTATVIFFHMYCYILLVLAKLYLNLQVIQECLMKVESYVWALTLMIHINKIKSSVLYKKS